MSENINVWVVSCVRTAIGSFGGSLKSVPPTVLATEVIREAINRAGVEPAIVQQAVMGHVILTETKDVYLSRYAAISAGLPHDSTAITLNRLCGSGLHAISTAALHIRAKDVSVSVAGGSESMSRSGFLLPALRWGQRMGSTSADDVMLAALHDPFKDIHMGVTAENLVGRYKLTREEQDKYALESNRRASNAQRSGYFEAQILPINVKEGRQASVFKEDERIRHDLEIDNLVKLKPIFDSNGTVTAGNSSGLNDGAAAALLMSDQALKDHKVDPMLRIVSVAHAGVDPDYMGIGPVQAVRTVLSRAGLSLKDIDVIESNEAFAAQCLSVARDLDFDPQKTNPNGGAIALGHPIAATGAMLLVKMAYELKRVKGRYGLLTMCIGGGQGIAMIVES
ncbi:beta-ketothiolase BktB [Candidatus Ichthyocystis hellenicum]|uniref:beta-ketothiolase BktB n=1 Tax=Candidatus Ichthyocystis hellenicum TaxID=1561003 RepID=UPI000AC4A3A6|nr:beta-ketothiolase BktB [Candidatus Ichthyocystis hellenicum]